MTELFQPSDVRTPADPEDFETTQTKSALPPVEFRVTNGAAANTFTITDRQAVPKRGATSSYRVYFLPAAFSPVPSGATATVGQSALSDLAVRRAGQRAASLVTEVSSTGRGDVLTAQDSQFFGQAGYYYCVGVNRQGVEAPAEHFVAAPQSTGAGSVVLALAGQGDAVALQASPPGTVQAGNVNLSGTVTAGGFIGPLTGNVTGNADTATILAIPRAINGVNFDGSTPITVTADANTLSGTTLHSPVVASSLTSVGRLVSLVGVSSAAKSAANTPAASFGSNDVANPLLCVIEHSNAGSRYHMNLIGTVFGVSGNDIDINRDDGTGGMTIQYQGNVGIGTTAPQTALQVGGATAALNSPIQWSAGTTPLAVPGVIFTQTADKITVANTNSTILGTGVGTKTMPANGFIVGRAVCVKAGGYISAINAPAGAPTLTLVVGTTVIAQQTGGLAFITTLNDGWTVDVTFTCRSVGAVGGVIGTGFFLTSLGGTSNPVGVIVGAGVAQIVNTTGTLAIDLQLNNGAAVGTYTSVWATIEVLN